MEVRCYGVTMKQLRWEQVNLDRKTWSRRKMHGPCGISALKRDGCVHLVHSTKTLFGNLLPTVTFWGKISVNNHGLSHGFQLLLFLVGSRKRSRLFHPSRHDEIRLSLSQLCGVRKKKSRHYSYPSSGHCAPHSFGVENHSTVESTASRPGSIVVPP